MARRLFTCLIILLNLPLLQLFSSVFFKGLSSLLLMSAFLGLLIVDVTYPEERQDQTFYLFEIFFSCLFFFVVILIHFIKKNENMTQYVFHKMYNLKFVTHFIALNAMIKGKFFIFFNQNQVVPLSAENNLI
jgi:hypothetical protein